jgi:hypothetical protein
MMRMLSIAVWLGRRRNVRDGVTNPVPLDDSSACIIMLIADDVELLSANKE